MWDERYQQPGYLFGTGPAAFLQREAYRLAPQSRVLAVADGEGRNSVFLARQGHDVVAMDSSAVGLEKARRLAAEHDVTIRFLEADIDAWEWTPDAFDAIVAIFIQFAPPAQRDRIFAGMARSLRPGGLLLLHGYAPRQVGYGTGGPPHAENMYTLPMLRAAFTGFEVLHEADYDADIQEGTGHAGRSALIDFIVRRAA